MKRKPIANKPTKPEPETWIRDVYEVHSSTNGFESWHVLVRNAKTLDEARARIRKQREDNDHLRWLIDLGKMPPIRIVHVVGTCTVIE
jgi:hypothetical protein